MNRIIALTSLLSFTSLSFTQANEASVIFINGDQLNGTIEKLSNNQIHLKHKAFKTEDGSQALHLNRIKSLTFPKKENAVLAENSITNLTMLGRLDKKVPIDIYKGVVKKINKDFVVIDTPYAGEMNMNKSFIEKLEIYDSHTLILPKLGNLKEWEKSEFSQNISQVNNSFFFAQANRSNSGYIFRKIDFPNIFELSTTVKKQPNNRNLSINLNLFTDDTGSAFTSSTSLVINLTPRKIVGHLQSKDQAQFKIVDHNVPPGTAQTGEWKIKLFVNMEKREFTMSLNDINIVEGADMGDFKIDKLGDHISFDTNIYNDTLELSDMSIKKWNGSLPGPPPEARLPLVGQIGEAIKLQNGDIVYGLIEEITEGIAKIKTKYNTYKIRLNKISSISLSENNEILMQENDALIKFTDGSSFIVKIEKIKDNKVFGSSQAFDGLLGFDIEQIRSIDFQNSIYQ